jgi:hypothetical protein
MWLTYVIFIKWLENTHTHLYKVDSLNKNKMKKIKISIPVFRLVYFPIMIGSCKLFPYVTKLVVTREHIMISDHSKPANIAGKNLEKQKKINYQSKTLHHRRHGADRRN